MRIAAAQINVAPGRVEENTHKMLTYVERAVKAGADVVVFPEMSDTGYDMSLIIQNFKRRRVIITSILSQAFQNARTMLFITRP